VAISLNFRVWKYLKSGFGILSSKVTNIQKEILPVKLWWICLVQVQKSCDNSFLHWPRKTISVLRSGIPGASEYGSDFFAFVMQEGQCHQWGCLHMEEEETCTGMDLLCLSRFTHFLEVMGRTCMAQVQDPFILMDL
jgi:hypothetical protein